MTRISSAKESRRLRKFSDSIAGLLEYSNSLNKDDYKDYSAVQSAIDAVVRGKNITEQASVDDMAKAIENAIIALEKKSEEIKPESPDIPPSAGDNINTILWLTLLFISGGTIIGATVVGRKRKNNCC
mgnify:CR=1 FL=1